ncbi:MAG: ATP synthase F1 subunit epsilon [Flavobacteriales bacterium]|nr:ATP synthase F1 subunit epsilon [Flavobacteriales bacterium]
MKVEILTPEATLFEGEASFVYLPGSDGSLGILNRHAPLISSMKKGTLRIKDGAGKEHRFEVKGGTVEVLNNKVIILAE